MSSQRVHERKVLYQLHRLKAIRVGYDLWISGDGEFVYLRVVIGVLRPLGTLIPFVGIQVVGKVDHIVVQKVELQSRAVELEEIRESWVFPVGYSLSQ